MALTKKDLEAIGQLIDTRLDKFEERFTNKIDIKLENLEKRMKEYTDKAVVKMQAYTDKSLKKLKAKFIES